MPALSIPSGLALPAPLTAAAQQQRAASELTADDESNVLSIVFGVLGTAAALLSFLVGYRQLVAARRSIGASDVLPVELDGTGP